MAYSGLVFGWEQNAADALIERLTFLTDVLEHRDASEQRRQVRLDPRRQIEFSVLPLDDHERSALDTFMWGAMRSPVMVPVWSDPQTLQTQANSGQPVVAIPTTTYDFDAGAYICLWRGWNNYEVVQISSLTASSVTCTENLVGTWPASVTTVLPARLGRINARQSSARLGGGNLTPSIVQEGVCDAVSWKVVFDIDESSRSINRLGSLTPTQYLGVDVYPADPDYAEALSLDLDAKFGVIDGQTGIVAIDSAAKLFPSQIFQYNDKFFTRADISTFLNYVHRWGGSRVPFWLTTGENDFVPTAIGEGLTAWLTYRATGYPTFVSGTYRNAIALRYLRPGVIQPQGMELYRPILASQVLGGGLERIQINTEFIGSEDYDKFRVSFLRYCRLESDLVELSWINGCMANVRLTIRELPNYPTP